MRKLLLLVPVVLLSGCYYSANEIDEKPDGSAVLKLKGFDHAVWVTPFKFDGHDYLAFKGRTEQHGFSILNDPNCPKCQPKR